MPTNSNIGLFIAESHRPNKSLIFNRPPSEIRSYKRRLGNHTFPSYISLVVMLYSLFGHAIVLKWLSAVPAAGIGVARQAMREEIRDTFLRSLLPSFNDLEHFVLSNTFDLWQWHRKPSCVFVPLVLD